MNIAELLKGVNCSCGKFHNCDIDFVSIRNGAIEDLTNLCRDYSKILLIADENTYAAAGEKTENALKNKNIKRVIFDGMPILIPNEEAIEKATNALGDSEIIIGIGSGVIQDLCKYVSFQNKIPYMIVATAPSMDGYASTGAAMITDGMKVTYPAGVPKAIIADTAVLKDAPLEMIKAGYGDIIGKFSALNDWKLSHLVNGEYFCDYIYNLTAEMVDKTLSLSDGLLERKEESVKTLMEALVIVGIAMSFAGSSRPASGSEHHLSHFFEITGILDNTDYFVHGIDVAYSTVITAKIREKLLKTTFDTYTETDKEDYRNKMQEIYKSSAEGCIALQEKVGNYKNNRFDIYKSREKEIKEILSDMPSASEIEEMLSRVNLNMDEFYNMYSKERIENAVLYAKDLKDRYTVLWLNYDLR